MAAKTLPPGTADLSVRILSQAVLVLLPRDVLSVVVVYLACCPWKEEMMCGAMLEVNNLTPDWQNLSALKRCLRSQKMVKLSIKFTD